MLIPIEKVIELAGPINGACHIGAYVGEEKPIYDKAGIKNQLYVEANPFLFRDLQQNVGRENAFNYLITDTDDQSKDFNLIYSDDMTNKGCSSIFTMSPTMINYYPMIKQRNTIKLKTITLDTLIKRHNKNFSDYQFLNMDVQGAELLCLVGMTEALKHFKVLSMEFATVKLYDHQCLLNDLDNFLKLHNFERVETVFASDTGAGQFWGDCLYLKGK